MNPNELKDFLPKLWPKVYPQDRHFAVHTGDIRIQQSAFFVNFFTSPSGMALIEQSGFNLVESESIPLDVERLVGVIGVRNFVEDLIQSPSEVISCMTVAFSVISNRLAPHREKCHVVRPRLYNLPDNTSFLDIKSARVGQLASIVGHVIRISPCRPLVLTSMYTCPKCGDSFEDTFQDGVYEPPKECPAQDPRTSKKCGNKVGLEFDRSRVQTCPYQVIKLQECDINDQDGARMPRTIQVEVRSDLVNRCLVGDKIKVAGIISTMQIAPPKFSKGVTKEQGLHELYINAQSVIVFSKDPMNKSSNSFLNNSNESVQSSSQDSKFATTIREIATNPQCLELLIASLCPLIYGNEHVKFGLLLSLFGGTEYRVTKNDSNLGSNSFNVRSDIHLLMVGDPGLGKSQLLRAVTTVASRVVLVCGNTATNAGLTVAVSREGRDTSLEAGALVLADRGVCCIDELDKMTCDSHALLEAMEQQRISVAKAGVVTSLHSRASVVAAANPSNGHYNSRKSLHENLKMPSALLSRFDLVFIMLDKPEEALDRKISEHIMKSHGYNTSSNNRNLASSGGTNRDKTFSGNNSNSNNNSNNYSSSSNINGDEQMTLRQKLRSGVKALIDEIESRNSSSSRPGTLSYIPSTILKVYIDYARRYCHPRLSIPAVKVLQRFYIKMRSNSALPGSDSMPITTRHLESLIRLSQARAKLELREEVTESDATDVVQLLEESVLDAFTNDRGQVAFGGKRVGGLAKQVKALVAALKKETDNKNSTMLTKQEITDVANRLKLEKDSDSLIEILRTECYLLYKGPKLYSLQCYE